MRLRRQAIGTLGGSLCDRPFPAPNPTHPQGAFIFPAFSFPGLVFYSMDFTVILQDFNSLEALF